MLLEAVKQQKPLILNYANTVTQQHVADGISMIGASPLMTQEVLEVPELVEIAQAVVINIGTLQEKDLPMVILMGQMANRAGKPVILDPVAVAMPYRSSFIQRLRVAVKFDIIRGNADEIAWFAESKGQGQGIDADTQASLQINIPQRAAQLTGAVIIQTGVVDVITDGEKTWLVENDNPLLAVNVGAGDLLSGLVGCFAAVTQDYVQAGLTATMLMATSGTLASDQVEHQPGQLMPVLMDQLYKMTWKKMQQISEVKQG